MMFSVSNLFVCLTLIKHRLCQPSRAGLFNAVFQRVRTVICGGPRAPGGPNSASEVHCFHADRLDECDIVIVLQSPATSRRSLFFTCTSRISAASGARARSSALLRSKPRA